MFYNLYDSHAHESLFKLIHLFAADYYTTATYRQANGRTDVRMLDCQFQAKLPKTDTDFNSVNVKLSELKFNFRVYLISSLAGCLDIDLYI